MDDGRIIRILDSNTIVMNLGSDHDVERGARFGIFTPVDDMLDPETGESLGGYQRRKGVVIADEVHPRFTVCTTPTVKQEYTEESGIGLFGSRQRRTRQVPRELDIAIGAEQPMPTGDEVRVGDIVAPLG